jgi:hypothetical protein
MRDWWLRTLLVLQRPRPVFVALRDTSKESVSDRSEQVLLIVLLVGIAAVLATGTAAHLMDPKRDVFGHVVGPSDFDNTLVAVWAFFGGGLFGLFWYYVAGALLYAGARVLGSQGTYLRARHVLAFATVPIALSLLLLWPVKLALYGDALFKTGGGDAHSGGRAFEALGFLFAAWSAVLLVVGVRAVHGWTWARALAACGLAVVLPAVLAVALAAR